MRLIVNETQYNKILREQQSHNDSYMGITNFIYDNIILYENTLIEETTIRKNNLDKLNINCPYKKIHLTLYRGDSIEVTSNIENNLLEVDVSLPKKINHTNLKNSLILEFNKKNILLEQIILYGINMENLLVGDILNINALAADIKKVLNYDTSTLHKKLFFINGDETFKDGKELNIDTSKFTQEELILIDSILKDSNRYKTNVEKDNENITAINIDFDPSIALTNLHSVDHDEMGTGSLDNSLVDINHEDLIILDPNSSPFGMRNAIKSLCDQGHSKYCKKHPHYGQDYKYPKGTKVILFKPGTVTEKGCECLKIKHDDGTSSRYCHLDKKKVDKGDKIEAGTFIGTVGGKGYTKGKGCYNKYGMHLHLEYIENGKAVDPVDFGKKYVRFLDKNTDYKKIKR